MNEQTNPARTPANPRTVKEAFEAAIVGIVDQVSL